MGKNRKSDGFFLQCIMMVANWRFILIFSYWRLALSHIWYGPLFCFFLSLSCFPQTIIVNKHLNQDFF